MLLRTWRAVPWVVALAGVLVLWSGHVPLPGGRRLDALTPFAQLLAARPLAVVVAVVLAVGALWLARRHRTAALAPLLLLVAAVAAAVQIAPRARSSAAPAPADAPALTVLSANVLRSAVRPATIATLVRRTGADVVALPEANGDVARRYAAALAAAGEGRWRAWSDREHAPDDPSAGPTSLLVRAALGPVRLGAPRTPDGAHGGVRVRLARTPGGGPGAVVAAGHPRPPYPAATQAQWRADLLALRPLCATTDVVAGDLNATVDHSPLRAVLDAGCRDAAVDAGQGLHATWTGGPLGWLRPAIDHVLTGRAARTAEAGVLPLEGSDHRALWARVVLRPTRS